MVLLLTSWLAPRAPSMTMIGVLSEPLWIGQKQSKGNEMEKGVFELLNDYFSFKALSGVRKSRRNAIFIITHITVYKLL